MFLHPPSLYLLFVGKVQLYTEAAGPSLAISRRLDLDFCFAAREISLLTQGFLRKADVDKPLFMPNPDCEEGLACALAADESGALGNSSSGREEAAGGELALTGYTLHNHGFGVLAKVGILGGKPYQTLAQIT